MCNTVHYYTKRIYRKAFYYITLRNYLQLSLFKRLQFICFIFVNVTMLILICQNRKGYKKVKYNSNASESIL